MIILICLSGIATMLIALYGFGNALNGIYYSKDKRKVRLNIVLATFHVVMCCVGSWMMHSVF